MVANWWIVGVFFCGSDCMSECTNEYVMCLIRSATTLPNSSEMQANPGLSISPAPHLLPDNPKANVTSHRQKLTRKQSP